MKFCKDCKHCAIPRNIGVIHSLCTHPDIAKYHPVTGENNAYCSVERTVGHTCGPKGKLFEPFELKLEVVGSGGPGQ